MEINIDDIEQCVEAIEEIIAQHGVQILEKCLQPDEALNMLENLGGLSLYKSSELLDVILDDELHEEYTRRYGNPDEYETTEAAALALMDKLQYEPDEKRQRVLWAIQERSQHDVKMSA